MILGVLDIFFPNVTSSRGSMQISHSDLPAGRPGGAVAFQIVYQLPTIVTCGCGDPSSRRGSSEVPPPYPRRSKTTVLTVFPISSTIGRGRRLPPPEGVRRSSRIRELQEGVGMDPEEQPPSSTAQTPEPPPSEAVTTPIPASSQQQQPPPPQPLETSASKPPSSEPTPTPPSAPPAQQQNPHFQTQPLQRPPVPPTPRARPPLQQQQQPYSHFHQQITTPSPTSSPSIMGAPSVSSSGVQRAGLAIGVPAHHHPSRPPQQQQQGGSVPFSSFGSTPSFGVMQPRSSVGVLDQPSNPNVQGRPVQGIQTIGMVGSLSNASHMRSPPVSTLNQQRPGQPPLRSITPGTIGTTATQKLSNQGMARVSSMASASPVGTAQSSQPLHQPWMSSQARPTSSLSSTSYRPQIRHQGLQQRPVQQQQQHQVPQKPQQQHSLTQKPQQLDQSSPKNQAVINQSQQQLITKGQQGIPQQQQLALRGTNQKTQNPATGQPSTNQPGTIVPVVTVDHDESDGHILRKRSIHELVSQIDPSEKLDPEVEDILVEIADDFIDSITTVACSLAKHRKSTTLEAKDVLLHVERNWNMTLPGFSGDDIKGYKKPFVSDIHKERLAMIKKSMAGSNDGGNMKNSAPGQHNPNVKNHAAAKASMIGSPKLM